MLLLLIIISAIAFALCLVNLKYNKKTSIIGCLLILFQLLYNIMPIISSHEYIHTISSFLKLTMTLPIIIFFLFLIIYNWKVWLIPSLINIGLSIFLFVKFIQFMTHMFSTWNMDWLHKTLLFNILCMQIHAVVSEILRTFVSERLQR